MRIIIHTSALEMGGAERVLTTMANYWAEKGWEIIILTHDDGSEPPFFELAESVRLIPMGTGAPYAGLLAALTRNIGRTLCVRKELVKAQPDCIIALGESNGVRSILASLRLGVPVIVGEHSDYRDTASSTSGWIWDLLRSLFYPLADRIVVLTQWSKECFNDRIQRKATVIPDPVPTDWLAGIKAGPEAASGLPENTIAGMGRFVRQKRFDLLLRAFALVARENECSLIIAGDGPLRPELEELTRRLDLVDRVMMPGLIKDPWRLLSNATMFVLSSEFEPFGMVLVEAMFCGMPVISFDCPAGPREIIRHGIDGILVPPLDVEALAREMARLLNEADERKRLAERGPEVVERFGPERVMGIWEELLAEVCPDRRRPRP